MVIFQQEKFITKVAVILAKSLPSTQSGAEIYLLSGFLPSLLESEPKDSSLGVKDRNDEFSDSLIFTPTLECFCSYR